MTQPTLSREFCRQRQARLRERLAAASIDNAILITPENIQYLTGFRPHRLMQAIVCLNVDEDCLLIAPNEEPDGHAADRCVTFAAQRHCTLTQTQLLDAAAALKDALGSRQLEYIGLEGSQTTAAVAMFLGNPSSWTDIDPLLWQLRRRKDSDELEMIRKAIACTTAMYSRAREIIAPGISELEVFNQLHAAAVEEAGEPLTALGNDFQCHSPGGPPRRRAACAGELYILDLGPAYRGYYADNCRTFAVDRWPTDDQIAAWEATVAVLEMVEQTVRPGVSCRSLFEQAKVMLDGHTPGAFFHHLGHGFGLFPHEAPHLNPDWNDTFEVGDCFTAEPGLYCESLHAGIRLEQDYLVTESGIERLTDFPLDL
ncbi:MAG: aminopeptidase P family protein [Planctomycetaceae bacterium]|nr:aminopeptidase P family protein [Planctomycetaceae bacterium]